MLGTNRGHTVWHFHKIRRGMSYAFLSFILGLAAVPSFGVSASAVTPSKGWRVTTAPSDQWYAATYAAGRFVVVGHGVSVATSSNGASWSVRPAPNGSWQSVAYGDGKFVALSALGSGPTEMTSSNGLQWSVRPGPVGEWTGLTYGGGRFVAVSAQGQFITSTDGVHWQATWTRSQFVLNSVSYGNGRFVAVDSADGDALISLNGLTWSFYPISTPGDPWYAVTYGNGVFSAFTPSGSVATSMLGYDWVTHHASPAQQINGSTFGCNTFVATGQATGRVNNILTSHTGTSWSATPVPADPSANWTAVAFGDGRFVAADTAGTLASLPVPGYCGPTVATPPKDVSGNVANAQVWTYQHPPLSSGGAPVDGYLVTISNGRQSATCHAPVYFEPNCIIRGLTDRVVYQVTTQVHNRFGYSAPTDPEFVIPVARWTLQAIVATPTITASRATTIQVTGIIANAAGIYPQSPVTIHFGVQTLYCVANPFGECLVSVAHPSVGRIAIWASYTGYGTFYRSAASYVTVQPH